MGVILPQNLENPRNSAFESKSLPDGTIADFAPRLKYSRFKAVIRGGWVLAPRSDTASS
jgi:hypothetical protein